VRGRGSADPPGASTFVSAVAGARRLSGRIFIIRRGRGNMPLSDIEIAQQAKMQRVAQVAAKLGIPEDSLEPYGHYKAKVSLKYIDGLKRKKDGKLILVTAISPTPAGEGKTTTTVGLGDALNHIGKKAIICLREPSLGPVFGVKGGAVGARFDAIVTLERGARPAAATRRSCR